MPVDVLAPRRYQRGDKVLVAGVPYRPDPAPAVVAAAETSTGVAYVRLDGCGFPVDVVRLTLVTAADSEVPARG